MDKLLAFLGVLLGLMLVAVMFGFLAAVPVMLLWNWVVAGQFHQPALTFMQSWGLMVLCSLLFKSGGSSSK